MFKMKKKSSGTPRKMLPKEEEQPAFAGMKLKKAQTVKRQWDEAGLEMVDLKHHEFEKLPQDEQVTISSEQSLFGKKVGSNKGAKFVLHLVSTILEKIAAEFCSIL